MTMGMRGVVPAVAVAVLTVLLGACAGPPEVRPAPPGAAAVVDGAPDCLADEVLVALTLAEPSGDDVKRPAPEVGSVPPGFDAVRVVECRAPEMILSMPPTSTVAATPAAPVVVVEVVLIGDLRPLLVALARQTDPISKDLACPAMFEFKPQIDLVDGQGRTVRPQWPVDACGFLHDGALAALAGLTEIRSIERVVDGG